MKKINPKELTDNVISLIGDKWMLVTAGNKSGFNTMTANWGGVGFLWNKPVVFVFIRPERHTYTFAEANDHFSLSFFSEQYRQALKICGATSGKTTDKVKTTGLTPEYTESGTPYFQEANIVMECKKLYADLLNPEAFIDQTPLQRWYTEGGLHKLYIAEIVNLWTE